MWKITEKSVESMSNALSYANSELNNAQVLKKICEFEFVSSRQDLIDLIEHHNNSTIHKYIGNIIIKIYKKEKAGEQSFWNTDASRFVYIIRKKVDTKPLWGKDIDAERIHSLVITPIIEYFIELTDNKKVKTTNYINKNSNNYKDNKIKNNIKLKENTYKDLINIKIALQDPKLSKNIIKYITPHFSINSHLTLAKNNK
jgi:homogentisate 1,2-dioxygenase